jgi:hypothetical protein
MHPAVFRPGVMYLSLSAIAAGLAAYVVHVLAVGSSGPRVSALAAVAIFALVFGPATRVRCDVDEEGLRIVNYARSHRVRWDEVESLLVDDPFLCPAPILLPSRPGVGCNECRTKGDRRIWITAFWAARVKKADRFQALVSEQAARYGFDARVAWGYAR